MRSISRRSRPELKDPAVSKPPIRFTDLSFELSESDRSALLWALEVGHALLLGDRDVVVLLAEPEVNAEHLDELADRLFLLKQPTSDGQA